MMVSSILGRNASCCDFKQLFPRLAGVALHGGTVVHGLTRKPPIGPKPDPVVPLEGELHGKVRKWRAELGKCRAGSGNVWICRQNRHGILHHQRTYIYNHRESRSKHISCALSHVIPIRRDQDWLLACGQRRCQAIRATVPAWQVRRPVDQRRGHSRANRFEPRRHARRAV